MVNTSRACASRRALLDVAGARAAREDEPQIARAFGQRHQQLVGLRRDPDLVDAGDPRAPRPRRRRARYTPRRGIGIIMTPEARRFAHVRRGIFAERVAQQQLLSEIADSRTADCLDCRLGSAAPGRTGRRSAAPRLRARRRRPAFTRHSAWIGPCRKPSPRGPRRRRRRWRAARRRRRRGRDVDRFLEERTVERIGLVEDREHVQLAVVSSPSSAYSRPGMNPSTSAVACARSARRAPPAAAAARRSRSNAATSPPACRPASRRGCPTAPAA